MVSVDGNLYSVPDSARRRVVEVHNTGDEVRILEAGHVIAVHPVLDGRRQQRILAGHAAPDHITAGYSGECGSDAAAMRAAGLHRQYTRTALLVGTPVFRKRYYVSAAVGVGK